MQDAFTNSLARIGFSQPNVINGTSYPITRLSRNYNLMNSLYRDSWICRRVIDTIANDMFKNWIELTSSITPEEMKKVEKLIRVSRVRQKLLEAMKWGRLYGGAAAIIMIDGDEDRLDEPLELEQIMPGDFKGLIVVDRWSGITPLLELVDDLSSPDYGLPKYYQFSTEQTGEALRVHHSRVLRFCGPELPNWEKQAEVYWGASIMEQVFEELKKRDNTSWNIAQLIFLSNIRVLKMSDLGQLLSTVNQKTKRDLYQTIEAQNALMSNMGIYVMDKEDDFQQMNYSFSGVSDIYELFMLDISGAAETPATRLFGRSPAGMNSTGEGEERNYNGVVEQRQESDLRPQLEKLLPVIYMSALGYIPEDDEFIFNPVETPSQKDKADLIWRSVEAINSSFGSGIISQKIALKELKQVGEPLGIFTNITDEDIDRANNDLENQDLIDGGENEQPMEVQEDE